MDGELCCVCKTQPVSDHDPDMCPECLAEDIREEMRQAYLEDR